MTLLSRSSGSFPGRQNKGVIQASLSICHLLNMNLTAKFSVMEKACMGVYMCIYIYIYVCVWDQIPDQQLWSLTIYSSASLSSWLITWPLWCRRTPISVCRRAQIVLRLIRWYFCKRLQVLHIYVSFYLFRKLFLAALFISVTLAGSPALSWSLWSELVQIRSERHRTSWGSQ